MNIEDRIIYWRGRMRAAERAGLEEEAAVCCVIADLLCDTLRRLRKTDKEVRRLMEVNNLGAGDSGNALA